jgi:hypothetical protein
VGAGEDEESRPKPKHAETEFTLVPVVGGDSDIGFGAGYVGALARLRPDSPPFLWRLESSGAISGVLRDGRPKLSYFDDSFTLTLPRAFHDRIRLEATVGFTDEPRLDYYGIGNQSTIPENRDPSEDHFHFRRMNATGEALARYRVYMWFNALWGVRYVHNEVRYASDSRIALDLSSPSGVVRDLVRAARREENVQFSLGVEWDDRDHEVITRKGQFHTILVDMSPGGFGPFPFPWGRVDVMLRGYAPLVKNRLTVAGRLVLDALFGDPPFYELSKYRLSQALGGGRGVRGVPGGRYFGMAKVFTNLELRSELFGFRAFSKQNVVGVTLFADGGRVFSHYRSEPELDGTSLGLKYGTGVGLRIAAGTSFVVRADLAWSPDARPVGGYLLGGQLF